MAADFVETGDVLGGSVADASVRLAAATDADAIGAVQARCWRSQYAQLLPAAALDGLAPDALARSWREAIVRPPTPRHRVLVACSGATVVGFAAICPSADPDTGPADGELAALLVDPAHQRSGHGSRLLSAAVDALRGNGSTGVVAWVPEADRARQAFLVSAGMVLDGARRSYPVDSAPGQDAGATVTELRLTAALGLVTGPSVDRGRAAVLRQAASVGLATGTYGVSFGALSVSSGLSLLQTCALSLLMFTGGSQFAFVGVVGAGGGGAAAIATAGLLGVRNGFYGLQLAPLLRLRGTRRVAAAQLTIDESTAVGTAQLALRPDRPELVAVGFWATGLAVFGLWNLSTVIGALVGNALGDPRRYGLDAAAAGAFLALLWPRLRSAEPRLVALGAAAVAVTLVVPAPAGVPVLAAAAVALAAGWRTPQGPR